MTTERYLRLLDDGERYAGNRACCGQLAVLPLA